jgi:hypothetical protein
MERSDYCIYFMDVISIDRQLIQAGLPVCYINSVMRSIIRIFKSYTSIGTRKQVS